jgi:hypothetical protein
MTGHALLACIPHIFLGVTRNNSNCLHHGDHERYCRRQKIIGFRFSVFKGREASLNRAIFAILAREGPKTIIELQKQLNKQKSLHGTYYASVNKRIHCLEKAGYISPIPNTQSSSKAMCYGICSKALLAIYFSKKGPEEMLSKIGDKEAMIILSDLIHAFPPSGTE